MTLFTLAPAHRAIVLEHGTSEPGEIAALTEISQPDVGLVVNVGIEHSERLGGVDRIADEEATLLLAAGRYAVTNGDEPLLVERLPRARAHPLRFGVSAACDLRVVSRLVAESGTTDIVLAPQGPFFAVREPGGELRISTPLLGEHVALNVAAAVLAALALLDRRASASEIDAMKAAVAAVEAVPGRLQPRRIGELLVIDDSYNSNPRSLRAALATARELADRRGSRLVLALGDMLELGDLAATEHRALLQLAAESGAQEILLVGAESARALEGLPAPHHSLYRIFRTSTEAASRIDDVVQPGDVVLVKGSRGIQMERLIETLEKAR